MSGVVRQALGHERGVRVKRSVVVVGGGFAGVACAKGLAKHGVDVHLIDRTTGVRTALIEGVARGQPGHRGCPRVGQHVSQQLSGGHVEDPQGAALVAAGGHAERHPRTVG